MQTLRYEDYLDKVHAGWIGKCIGGAIGYIQENNKNVLTYTPETAFPATIPANDDLDLQVLWLQELLEKKGSFFTERDVAEVFAKYNLLMAGEYSFAIRNIELSIAPPYSGSFNNSFWKHSMGCPIRSEIWGFVCPGNPDAAVRYAYMDGIIDHVSESIYGEQFYAAIEAMSFFETDLRQLLEKAMNRYVPGNSRLSQCLEHVIRMYDAGKDWEAARADMLRRYGSSDASDAVTNIALTVMALLYGEGDFGKTMMLAVNCGYDTDCTAATAGAILGVIGGTGAIPDWWLRKVGERFVIGTVDIQRHSDLIIDLAKDTCAAGLSLARDGVIEMTFADVPAGVEPSLPLPDTADRGRLAIEVEYEGLPSVGIGEPATITLIVRNDSDRQMTGRLTLSVPEPLESEWTEQAFVVPPSRGEESGVLRMQVSVSVKSGTAVLPQRNVLTARVKADDGNAAEREFGLSGAARVKLIGPFWDNYDTTRFESDPYGETTQKLNGIADPHAMFNSFADIDRAYVEESSGGFDAAEGEYINLHEDRIDLRPHVGYEGPCCLYFVHDFVVPTERADAELFVGNNEAFKLWLNGEEVLASRSSDGYMPFNHFRLDAHYREGINRIVVKLVRKGEHFDFSYLMRSPQLGFRWFVDTEHVIHG